MFFCPTFGGHINLRVLTKVFTCTYTGKYDLLTEVFMCNYCMYV